jgi:hypothetical protein
MADGRKNNGGHKTAGRKPKAEEDKLIERLDAIINQDEALDALKKKVYKGDGRALELYMKYRYGLPKQKTEITMDNEPFILKLNGVKPETE